MVLTRLHLPEEPLAQVFLFPHAGGSIHEYALLAGGLEHTQLTGVQLPGRGARFSEPSIPDVRRLSEHVADHIRSDVPFLFLGHSFGALLAFETCRVLRARRAHPLPEQLWVSAFPPPDRIPQTPPLHRLESTALLQELSGRFGAIPDEVLSNPELAELVSDYIRSDYQAMETYHFEEEPPLDVDITVLWGREDRPSVGDAREWRRHTGAAFSALEFDGGHFYLHDPVNARRLSRLLDGAARPSPTDRKEPA